ncbi:UNVERIFIED_CONTAM: Calcium-binding protein 7, partial [Eudyptes robustus]
MPFHPVTAALMYRGIYTVPNILAEQHPVEIPEDELEGFSVPALARGGRWREAGHPLGTLLGSHQPRPARGSAGHQPFSHQKWGGGGSSQKAAPKGAGRPHSITATPWAGSQHGVSPCLSHPPQQCDMQKLTVDELKRLLYDTFCEHLSMKDIENIIMTEEESHMGTAEECPVDVETCSSQQIRQTCVRKSLICAFAIAFIISVMLIAANQVLRSGMK